MSAFHTCAAAPPTAYLGHDAACLVPWSATSVRISRPLSIMRRRALALEPRRRRRWRLRFGRPRDHARCLKWKLRGPTPCGHIRIFAMPLKAHRPVPQGVDEALKLIISSWVCRDLARFRQPTGSNPDAGAPIAVLHPLAHLEKKLG